MKEILIKAVFPVELTPILDHPEGHCMVVPLTADEVQWLWAALKATSELLNFNRRALRTLKELTETKADSAKQVLDTVNKMLEPAVAAADNFDTACGIIGRALFIENDSKKGHIQ